MEKNSNNFKTYSHFSNNDQEKLPWKILVCIVQDILVDILVQVHRIFFKYLTKWMFEKSVISEFLLNNLALSEFYFLFTS